jgi:hypothetical protein
MARSSHAADGAKATQPQLRVSALIGYEGTNGAIRVTPPCGLLELTLLTLGIGMSQAAASRVYATFCSSARMPAWCCARCLTMRALPSR